MSTVKFRSVWVNHLSCGLSILLLGCASPTEISSANAGTGNDAAPPVRPELSQELPITAQAEMAGQVIQLEVTQTPQQQALGLMYREALPDDRGMLFSFDSPRPVQFWMKNVPVPLDMVFLLNGEVQAIAASAPPCVNEPCPTYGPGTLVDQVIELRGGRAAELGLQTGDPVRIEFLEEESAATEVGS